jgi:chromosome segregation ATPase
MVSPEEYDKLKNAMEGLQTENSKLSLKLQDCMHQFHEAEYQKGEAVRLQGEAERKLVVEVDFFRKTDKALGSSSSELRRVKQQLTDAHGKLAGWQEQWDAFSASRKAKEEEMMAELTGQIEKLKILLREKNNALLCARSTNGYITDQLHEARGQIEELKMLAGLKKSRLEEVFGEDDGNYYR